MSAAPRWQVVCAAALMAAPALLSWRAAAGPHPAGAFDTSGTSGPAALQPGVETVVRAREALASAESTHGAASRQVAEALDALVTAMNVSGDGAPAGEALRLAERSLGLWVSLTGETSLETATALSSYADGLMRLEEFRAARRPADRALQIRLRDPRAGAARVAQSSYQVAELMRMAGDYAGACGMHERAIAAWRSQPGGGHLPGIASSLHYLGLLKATMGDDAGATALVEESLAIRERLPRLPGNELAASLNLLGLLTLESGDRARAMSLFGRAQRIWEQALGPRHGHVARSLVNQANLLLQAGDAVEARRLYERALALRMQAFGPGHYLTARSLANLARVSVATGDLQQAHGFFERALAIQREDPEARGPELAETLIDDARLTLTTGDPARALELALEAESLARENFLRTSRGLSEPEALRYETVRSSGLDVALTVLEPVSGPDVEGVSRVWDEAIRSRAMVLDEMAARHRTDGFDRPSPRRASGLAEVAAAVPDGSSLVAYLKYRRQPRHEGETPGAAYVGFVLEGDGQVRAMVPLGDALEIDRLIAAWGAQVGSDPRAAPAGQGEVRCREAGRRLREAIWDPVARLIEGSQMVFVVPDGAIGLVSLAALPAGEDRYLIEQEPLIHYLSAERDLAAAARPAQPARRILALGGPSFDAAPEDALSPAGESQPDVFRSVLPSCPAFASMRFGPLTGSLREADDVEAFWRTRADVSKLTGAGATEAALKQAAPRHDMLHLATHGYFQRDGCAQVRPGRASYGMAAPPIDNPLLMTGLALAGANHRAEAGQNAEDGMLTAEEIGALDLSGVRWAVLSGCETGLGPVMDGEGVLGLRRAFQVAGAGTLIMSLWPVDDGATRLWMKQLYEGRLAGLSTVQAVGQSSLEMLRRQRAAGHGGHPYYWGGFVAAGEWR